MSRQGTGSRVELRMYMEGILVENGLANVSVSGDIGMPASAQLELVPTNTIKHILPGTWIHVFVTDPWEVNPTGNLDDFKLLFEGVVSAKGFTKTDDGRNFTVQCIAPEVFWTEARQFWVNLAAGSSLVDQIVVQTSGGSGRFGMIGGNAKFGYMQSKLKKIEDGSEERFMDTLVSVLDDIGGVNPYYTNAKNRIRLTDRIVRGAAGKTEELFQISLFTDFLEGLASRTSDQSSLLEVINSLLGAILHEWVSVPAPPYIKSQVFDRDTFGNIKRGKSTVRKNTGDGKRKKKVDIYDFKTAQDDIIASIIFKPHIYTLSPPTCNILYPNMYDQMSYSHNHMNETTRLQMQPQLFSSAFRKISKHLRIMRPTELEIFTGLTRDKKAGTRGKRTPDAKYADGAGQAPVFHDYDWATNEERIRGIKYNFINLAPAPGTLTMTSQGKRQPSGTRKGGAPKYLQNVASYEYYKSKFSARGATVSGPLNIRPVPGFSILLLDDSASQQNIVAYLSGITHSISADGMATTQYSISLPRLTDEVDYNRPKFKKSATGENEIDFDLFRDEEGRYDFAKLFDGVNEPPIPEWFDDDYKNLLDLDVRYREWFGTNVGVTQNLLFVDPEQTEKNAIANQEAARAVYLEENGVEPEPGEIPDYPKSLKDDIVQSNNTIGLNEAVLELNERYTKARGNGREKEEAGVRTARAFTKIDEAFRFIGASPFELSDQAIGEKSKSDQTTFVKNPASERVINYKTMRLDRFVGDTSPGSGYSGVPEGESKETNDSSGSGVSERMSGAFSKFDTIVHTGDKALKTKERADAVKAESAPSSSPRYDGRPRMYDFEFRIWQDSIKAAQAAGFTIDGEKIADSAAVADHYVNGSSGTIRGATAEEKAAARESRVATNAQRTAEESDRMSKGRHPVRRVRSRCPNMPPANQAPTGAGLEEELVLPLPQPLSEKQVINIRRSIIDAYRDELERTRGFTG